MLISKPTIELSIIVAATITIMISRYIMFEIVDLVFLLIVLCGINACWDRYFNEEGESNVG